MDESSSSVPQWVWYTLGFFLAVVPLCCIVGLCMWCNKFSRKQVEDVFSKSKSRQYVVAAAAGGGDGGGGDAPGEDDVEEGGTPQEGDGTPQDRGSSSPGEGGVVITTEEEIPHEGCYFNNRNSVEDGEEEDSWDECYVSDFDSIGALPPSVPQIRAKSDAHAALGGTGLGHTRPYVRALSEPYATTLSTKQLERYCPPGVLQLPEDHLKFGSFCSINAADLNSDDEK